MREDMTMNLNFLSNKVVQIILAVLVVMAICWVTGFDVTIRAGASGFQFNAGHVAR